MSLYMLLGWGAVIVLSLLGALFLLKRSDLD